MYKQNFNLIMHVIAENSALRSESHRQMLSNNTEERILPARSAMMPPGSRVIF
jgi:hypothetical protein